MFMIQLIFLPILPTYFISTNYLFCQCQYFDTHLYVIIQLCYSLCSNIIQAIIYIIAKFNAHLPIFTQLLYCIAILCYYRFYGLALRDAGTLTDKQYSVIIVSVFCIMIVVIVCY